MLSLNTAILFISVFNNFFLKKKTISIVLKLSQPSSEYRVIKKKETVHVLLVDLKHNKYDINYKNLLAHFYIKKTIFGYK